MGASKFGVLLRGLRNKVYSTLGSASGSPCFRKRPCRVFGVCRDHDYKVHWV